MKSFDVGHLVWLYEPLQIKKLSCPWIGPCVVWEKSDDTAYRVQRSPRKEAKLYHADRSSLYSRKDVPVWIRRMFKGLMT